MKTVQIKAKWDPKPEFTLGSKDSEGKLTYLGSQVWRNPVVEIVEKPKPHIKPNEVLIKLKRCGICGSDVHMLQTHEDGYIYYPGLTAFPVTLDMSLLAKLLKLEVKQLIKELECFIKKENL